MCTLCGIGEPAAKNPNPNPATPRHEKGQTPGDPYRVVIARRRSRSGGGAALCPRLLNSSPAGCRSAARRVAGARLVWLPERGVALSLRAAEVSVLTRRRLQRRIDPRQTVAAETAAWADARNTRQVGVDRHFATADARLRLKNLHPKPRECCSTSVLS